MTTCPSSSFLFPPPVWLSFSSLGSSTAALGHGVSSGTKAVRTGKVAERFRPDTLAMRQTAASLNQRFILKVAQSAVADGRVSVTAYIMHAGARGSHVGI